MCVQVPRLFNHKSINDTFIYLNEIQAAIIGNECSDLFTVLDQLDPHTFSDSRIWLFGLNTSKKIYNSHSTFEN